MKWRAGRSSSSRISTIGSANHCGRVRRQGQSAGVAGARRAWHCLSVLIEDNLWMIRGFAHRDIPLYKRSAPKKGRAALGLELAGVTPVRRLHYMFGAWRDGASGCSDAGVSCADPANPWPPSNPVLEVATARPAVRHHHGLLWRRCRIAATDMARRSGFAGVCCRDDIPAGHPPPASPGRVDRTSCCAQHCGQLRGDRRFAGSAETTAFRPAFARTTSHRSGTGPVGKPSRDHCKNEMR